MATIRMFTLAAGPAGVLTPGSVVDVEDAIAAAFVEGGFAETAAIAAPENAARRPSRRKPAGRGSDSADGDQAPPSDSADGDENDGEDERDGE